MNRQWHHQLPRRLHGLGGSASSWGNWLMCLKCHILPLSRLGVYRQTAELLWDPQRLSFCGCSINLRILKCCRLTSTHTTVNRNYESLQQHICHPPPLLLRHNAACRASFQSCVSLFHNSFLQCNSPTVLFSKCQTSHSLTWLDSKEKKWIWKSFQYCFIKMLFVVSYGFCRKSRQIVCSKVLEGKKLNKFIFRSHEL